MSFLDSYSKLLNISKKIKMLTARIVILTSKHYTAYVCGFTEFLYLPPSQDLIHAKETNLYILFLCCSMVKSCSVRTSGRQNATFGPWYENILFHYNTVKSPVFVTCLSPSKIHHYICLLRQTNVYYLFWIFRGKQTHICCYFTCSWCETVCFCLHFVGL